jgi:chromosome segregation ATPase
MKSTTDPITAELNDIEQRDRAETLRSYWATIEDMAGNASKTSAKYAVSWRDDPKAWMRLRQSAGFTTADTATHIEQARDAAELRAQVAAHKEHPQAIKKALARESKLIAERDAEMVKWGARIEKAASRVRQLRSEANAIEAARRKLADIRSARIPHDWQTRHAETRREMQRIGRELSTWQSWKMEPRRVIGLDAAIERLSAELEQAQQAHGRIVDLIAMLDD